MIHAPGSLREYPWFDTDPLGISSLSREERRYDKVCVWHNRLRRMMFRFEYDTLFLLPLSKHVSPGCKDSITPVNPAVVCSQPRTLADSSVSNRRCPAFVIRETSSRIIRCISDKSLFFSSFTAHIRRSMTVR